MYSIDVDKYSIEIGDLLDSSFEKLLSQYSSSKKVIIVDGNTNKYCLHHLIKKFKSLNKAKIVVFPEGEKNKQITSSISVWESLTEYGIGRHDLIINLGGGVVTDMGGFIACSFKRGCDFINIPTSLLGMVDASIGGKTGVNLGRFKNQIGFFSNPKAVFIDTIFLDTLPESEIYSGLAEMMKYGLIYNKDIFNRVVKQYDDFRNIDQILLKDCVEVKKNIVGKDFFESSLRKILNFGHTIGHVIEGYYNTSLNLSHGHSIAIGMLMESSFSVDYSTLSKDDYNIIKKVITSNYEIPDFSNQAINDMVQMLENDKKNKEGKILTCLLREIGYCNYDFEISKKEFIDKFKSYKVS